MTGLVLSHQPQGFRCCVTYKFVSKIHELHLKMTHELYKCRCCPTNPNVSLQAGKGVPVGDGKVLI